MEGTYSLEPYPKDKLRSFLLIVITLGRLASRVLSRYSNILVNCYLRILKCVAHFRLDLDLRDFILNFKLFYNDLQSRKH